MWIRRVFAVAAVALGIAWWWSDSRVSDRVDSPDGTLTASVVRRESRRLDKSGIRITWILRLEGRGQTRWAGVGGTQAKRRSTGRTYSDLATVRARRYEVDWRSDGKSLELSVDGGVPLEVLLVGDQLFALRRNIGLDGIPAKPLTSDLAARVAATGLDPGTIDALRFLELEGSSNPHEYFLSRSPNVLLVVRPSFFTHGHVIARGPILVTGAASPPSLASDRWILLDDASMASKRLSAPVTYLRTTANRALRDPAGPVQNLPLTPRQSLIAASVSRHSERISSEATSPDGSVVARLFTANLVRAGASHTRGGPTVGSRSRLELETTGKRPATVLDRRFPGGSVSRYAQSIVWESDYELTWHRNGGDERIWVISGCAVAREVMWSPSELAIDLDGSVGEELVLSGVSPRDVEGMKIITLNDLQIGSILSTTPDTILRIPDDSDVHGSIVAFGPVWIGQRAVVRGSVLAKGWIVAEDESRIEGAACGTTVYQGSADIDVWIPHRHRFRRWLYESKRRNR